MRVLIHARHRYPARRDDGTGREPRTEPSGAPNHVVDLLARGLAEEGLDVAYLLPAGADDPLPPGVRLTTDPDEEADVLHNLEREGTPWFVTVQGHRPPAGYYNRVADGEVVPASGRGDEPPWDFPPGGICVSRTLAETFGGRPWILNGLDPAEFTSARRRRTTSSSWPGCRARRSRTSGAARGSRTRSPSPRRPVSR
jgi:hypothetical protein